MDISKLIGTIRDVVETVDEVKGKQTDRVAELEGQIEIYKVQLEQVRAQNSRLRLAIVKRDDKLAEIQGKLLELEQQVKDDEQG